MDGYGEVVDSLEFCFVSRSFSTLLTMSSALDQYITSREVPVVCFLALLYIDLEKRSYDPDNRSLGKTLLTSLNCSFYIMVVCRFSQQFNNVPLLPCSSFMGLGLFCETEQRKANQAGPCR
jgi:hypothetical protein